MDYKKTVLKWFSGNEFVYWRIVNADADGEVVAKVDDDELTIDDSIAKLALNLDTLPEGLYKIKARRKKQDTNGEVVHRFYVPESIHSTPKVSGVDDSRLSKLEAVIAKLEKEKQEREVEEKLRANDAKWEKKLEKLASAQQEGMFDKITGLLGILSGGKMPFLPTQQPQPQVQPQGINGTPTQQAEQEARTPNDEANQIIRVALSQMRQVFADDQSFLMFLQSAGNVAQHEPQKFALILQFLPKTEPQPTENEE